MSLAAAFAGVSLATSIFGGKKKSDAAKRAGRAEAAIHYANAQASEEEAAFVDRMNIEGQHIIARNRIAAVSTAKTIAGKGNIGGVTQFEVETEMASRFVEEQSRFATETRRKADKLRTAAEIDRLKASAAKSGASSASTAAWINAAADISSFGASDGFEPIFDLFK